MYNAVYLDEVLTDVQEAKIWYKTQKEGLEIEFADRIEQAIKTILSMPLAYATRYKNVRIAHPRVFPYNIHFHVNEPAKTVVFTAIVHNKRHPKRPSKRI